MTKKTLPQIVNDVYVLLDPLESADRQKVVGSVMTLLGEDTKLRSNNEVDGRNSEPPGDATTFGVKVDRWMTQNGLTTAMIEEVFHCEGGQVEVISSDVPGIGKKGQSQNCYLLAGAKAYLATGEAKFTDVEAVELCKHMGCHDSKNHATTRKELGNIVAGTKISGFTLPAPGLRAAGDLVKKMSDIN